MENKINNVRFQLDFGMIPKIFYKDPIDFVLRTRRVKSDYICALFNRYYDTLNPMYFPENPKHFTPENFCVRESVVGKLQLIIITLPQDHEGSLEYCLEHIIAYRKGIFGPKKARLFALERNLGGVLTIGAMNPDGTHTTLFRAGTEEENLALIAKAAAEK
jgi:hypothetical protein